MVSKKTKKEVKVKGVNIYSIDGKIKKKIGMPEIFNTEYRPDIIRKSVNAILANKRQPYGASPLAGKRHSAVWIGKGHGMSRVPRLADGTGSFAPGTVGGRRAHPPRSQRIWHEKINKKEKRKAVISALAATKNKELVTKRGHAFDEKLCLPVVVEDKFEDLMTTKEVVDTFQKIGIYQDIEKAKKKTHIRAGVGKRRGRKYREPKSVLVVVNKPTSIISAVRNLSGVDIATPGNLNVELLAPGGDAGRLTIFTESALKEVVSKFG